MRWGNLLALLLLDKLFPLSSSTKCLFFLTGGLPSLSRSSATLLGVFCGSSSGMARPLILRHSAVFIRLDNSD